MNMHPLYDPKTAFGNKALLKACPPEVEKQEGEETELEHITDWSSEATEYSIIWRCPCGAKNEDTVEFEPSSEDEVTCYRCSKIYILE